MSLTSASASLSLSVQPPPGANAFSPLLCKSYSRLVNLAATPRGGIFIRVQRQNIEPGICSFGLRTRERVNNAHRNVAKWIRAEGRNRAHMKSSETAAVWVHLE
jgi:hypothetical protein